MQFYLGTPEPSWLTRAGVPLFLSRRRLVRLRQLPRATAPWALDSGGFSELTLFGAWQTSPAQYVSEVRRFAAEVGGLEWAAIQDWMCEPFMLKRTGLTVKEHQARTLASWLDLTALAPELPWVPVLQGWRLDDYRRHAEAYARAGVELVTRDLVGLGSVCSRQDAEGVRISWELARDGLTRLHGFGFKLTGLQRGTPLISADSMSWSYQARRRGRQLPTCRHRSCSWCLPWALAWRQRVLDAIPVLLV